ncbi:hypothetical protein JFU47_12180 [Pseudomonas sp. TH39(2020)]|uniref:hypothetical protein n=1 Tax=Pseudomonas sp. TH39(2020) TaxID=2796349 RepID=UPI001912C3A8|nr:hypothetical protein [Pseudomonas sp. TH39(2020)]MBK5397455.1 hypothetical protein [Pseudomonas sp. TH39(2020)]
MTISQRCQMAVTPKACPNTTTRVSRGLWVQDGQPFGVDDFLLMQRVGIFDGLTALRGREHKRLPADQPSMSTTKLCAVQARLEPPQEAV